MNTSNPGAYNKKKQHNITKKKGKTNPNKKMVIDDLKRKKIKYVKNIEDKRQMELI